MNTEELKRAKRKARSLAIPLGVIAVALCLIHLATLIFIGAKTGSFDMSALLSTAGDAGVMSMLIAYATIDRD